MSAVQRKFNSKVGPMFMIATATGLKGLLWKESTKYPYAKGCDKTEALLNRVEKEITEYLNGERTTFAIPLDPDGTDFQKRVWNELAKIPYGKTKSYKDIATALKDPNACRAVGTANGRNPISIIVPCHRVIGANGKLTGYAGGLVVKEKLLIIEGFSTK